MPDDDMGNPDNLTTKDLKKAAKASNMSLKDTVNNVKAALEMLDVEKLEEENK